MPPPALPLPPDAQTGIDAGITPPHSGNRLDLVRNAILVVDRHGFHGEHFGLDAFVYDPTGDRNSEDEGEGKRWQRREFPRAIPHPSCPIRPAMCSSSAFSAPTPRCSATPA
jgi:hypothetical protein